MRTFLFLIFGSEERANNHQKQNTATLCRGAEASSSSKRNKWGVARREEPVYAGFELELVGAERSTCAIRGEAAKSKGVISDSTTICSRNSHPHLALLHCTLTKPESG